MPPEYVFRETRTVQAVYTLEQQGKGHKRQAIKKLFRKPLSTESTKWSRTGPPNEVYALGPPQVWLYQDQDLHSHHLYWRVNRPSDGCTREVRSKAAPGYPFRKSAVLHCKLFGVSSRSFKNTLQQKEEWMLSIRFTFDYADTPLLANQLLQVLMATRSV